MSHIATWLTSARTATRQGAQARWRQQAGVGDGLANAAGLGELRTPEPRVAPRGALGRSR